MKIGVRLKINVSKIDKALLFAGQKGKYLDATVFIDIDNVGQYGDNGMVVQDVKQGEQRGNILGNATVFWDDVGGSNQQQAPQRQHRSLSITSLISSLQPFVLSTIYHSFSPSL